MRLLRETCAIRGSRVEEAHGRDQRRVGGRGAELPLGQQQRGLDRVESRRVAGEPALWAIFEPRSATSRRKVFQDAYAEAFGAADVVIVAHPHDQGRIAEGERFDSRELVHALRAHGQEAFGYDTVEEIVAVVGANALPWDVVAVLSNGGFGGIHGKLITALGG